LAAQQAPEFALVKGWQFKVLGLAAEALPEKTEVTHARSDRKISLRI
jgi:hypothetical protein